MSDAPKKKAAKKKSKPDGDFVRVAKADFERMAADSAAAGIAAPSAAAHKPVVDIGAQVGELADTLGKCLRPRAIFRYGKEILAEDFDGNMRSMDSQWFCSWVEEFVSPERANRYGDMVPVSMGKDLAAKVLAAGQFRARLREIVHVRSVRMPVVRDEETLELLPLGYDEPTQTWTVGEVEFPEDVSLMDAIRKIDLWFGEWPWEECEKNILKSASCAAVVGMMLGQFCDSLFQSGDKRPMGVVNANQAGSGKSTLMRMVMAPVHGLPGEGDLPEDKQELLKVLQTAAINRRPYMLLDDIGKFLKSSALNRFITASVHEGRIMGGQNQFREANRTQVCVTGNNLEITVDLSRRSVVSGLFVPGEIQGRKFRFPITDAWLARPETRAEMLGVCWAIVREAWEQTRFEGVPEGLSFLQGFERWSIIVQCCLRAAKFTADPLAADRARTMVASEEVEMRMLLSALGDEIPAGDESATMEYPRIIEVARSLEVLEWLVGGVGDPDPKPDVRLRLGHKLKQWFARQVARKSDGRLVEFGKRKSRTARAVAVRLL
jgi:hypothetical protein